MLWLVVGVGGCDRVVDAVVGPKEAAPVVAAPATPVAAPAGAPAVTATPAAIATPAAAPVAAAVAAPAAEPVLGDCAALAKHVHAVLLATGSEREKAMLQSVEEAQRACESDRNDPKHMACFFAASDSAAFAKCNRDAFPGQVDVTPTRKFNALRDNSAVSPPVLSQDGDYLAYDDKCGMLYKEVAPAGALYVACNGRVEIGPLVTVDEVDRVIKQLSEIEDRRHEIATYLIAKTSSRAFGVPVHVYDSNGSYRGIEYR